MKRLLVLVIALLVLATGATWASPERGEEPTQGKMLGQKESWDYAPVMRKVARRFKGKEGVVLQLGDSITFAAPYTAWARAGAGKTREDEAVLRWSHCGEKNLCDGWWMAYQELSPRRSYTAASGIQASQYLAGGYRGLPPLDEIIRTHHPQVAILMLGTNDAWNDRPTADFIADMETIVTRLLDQNAVVILSTLPPHIVAPEKQAEYNQALWKLAERHRLPVIDYYGEILARRPGKSWDGTLLNKGDVHPSEDRNGVLSTSAPTPQNLTENGYLLRGWLSVKKLAEVKHRVLDRR